MTFDREIRSTYYQDNDLPVSTYKNSSMKQKGNKRFTLFLT